MQSFLSSTVCTNWNVFIQQLLIRPISYPKVKTYEIRYPRKTKMKWCIRPHFGNSLQSFKKCLKSISKCFEFNWLMLNDAFLTNIHEIWCRFRASRNIFSKWTWDVSWILTENLGKNRGAWLHKLDYIIYNAWFLFCQFLRAIFRI